MIDDTRYCKTVFYDTVQPRETTKNNQCGFCLIFVDYYKDLGTSLGCLGGFVPMYQETQLSKHLAFGIAM